MQNKPIRIAACAVVTLAIVLAACGSTTAAQHAHSPNPPVGTDHDIVTDTDGLHIEASFQCRDNIVLATDRTQYDAGEIQSIEQYFSQIPSGHTGVMPKTLLSVPGGPCEIQIAFANTSSTAVIVSSVGVKLLTPPQPNTYQYRLINFCSLVQDQGECMYGGTGGPMCINYVASIQLADAKSGAVYAAPPTPEEPTLPDGTVCPSRMTIDPGPDASFLNVSFTSPNVVYSVVLQLKLIEAAGAKTLTFSQWPNTLVFAQPDQFTCYSLHGTTFEFLDRGSVALTTSSEGTIGRNCL